MTNPKLYSEWLQWLYWRWVVNTAEVTDVSVDTIKRKTLDMAIDSTRQTSITETSLAFWEYVLFSDILPEALVSHEVNEQVVQQQLYQWVREYTVATAQSLSMGEQDALVEHVMSLYRSQAGLYQLTRIHFLKWFLVHYLSAEAVVRQVDKSVVMNEKLLAFRQLHPDLFDHIQVSEREGKATLVGELTAQHPMAALMLWYYQQFIYKAMLDSPADLLTLFLNNIAVEYLNYANGSVSVVYLNALLDEPVEPVKDVAP